MFRFKYSILFVLALSIHFTYFAMEQSNYSMSPDILESATRDQQQLVDQEDEEIEDDQYSKDEEEELRQLTRKVKRAEINKKIAERVWQNAKFELEKKWYSLPFENSESDEENEDRAPRDEEQFFKTIEDQRRKFDVSKFRKRRKNVRNNTTKVSQNNWPYISMGFGFGLIALVCFCQYKFYHMDEDDSKD